VVQTINKPPVYRVTYWQLAVLVVIAAPLLAGGRTLALSFLMGGLIQLAPSWWFARQAFRFAGASNTHRVLASIYWGETGKFLFSGLLFALVFVLLQPMDIIALFAGYVGMVLFNLAATFRVLRRQNFPQHNERI
jgi:ATP synthase protein I